MLGAWNAALMDPEERPWQRQQETDEPRFGIRSSRAPIAVGIQIIWNVNGLNDLNPQRYSLMTIEWFTTGIQLRISLMPRNKLMHIRTAHSHGGRYGGWGWGWGYLQPNQSQQMPLKTPRSP